jgi:hypothetical protein
MPEFAYLYRGGSRPESPEQAQQVMQKWIAWMKDLAERGHMVDRGQPLEPTGKIVHGANKSVIDGPFAEAKDVIGGFTLIKANDIAQAAELAKGCPIFEGGGQVEVRPIRQMNM